MHPRIVSLAFALFAVPWLGCPLVGVAPEDGGAPHPDDDVELCANPPRAIPDLDHCESAPCYPGVACTDEADGFACGACPDGLVGDGLFCAPRFTAVSAGHDHTCGLLEDGTARCWGENRSGQSFPPDESFVAIKAGASHTCGLTVDNTLRCWGELATPMGPGDVVETDPLGVEVLAFDVRYGGCAVDATGSLRCWGLDYFADPTLPAGNFVDVSVGAFHACALRDDGTVACWGGSLGDDSPAGGGFSKVRSAFDHSCALGGDGEITCWGTDDFGKSTPAAGPFVDFILGGSNPDLYLGGSAFDASGFGCGLREDGTISCWGYLGIVGGPPVNARRIVRLDSGPSHVCALDDDGALECWGWDHRGKASPPGGAFVDVALPDLPPAEAFMGGDLSLGCAITTDHRVRCFTDDDWNGPPEDRPSGLGPPSGRFVDVEVQMSGGCALDAAGVAHCFSGGIDVQTFLAPATSFAALSLAYDHGCGRADDGSWSCFSSTGGPRPAPRIGPTSPLAALSGGAKCGLSPAGEVVCWGGVNGEGLEGEGWVAVSEGRNDSCAIDADGAVHCTGAFAGDEPEGVFVDVGVGFSHACALDVGGEIACWGSAPYGAAVPPAGTFSRIAIGEGAGCALDAEGAATCWGQFNLVNATPDEPLLAVAMGKRAYELWFDRACGVTMTGSIVCWGFMSGQAPALEGPFVDVVVGARQVCGIRADGALACEGSVEAPPEGVYVDVGLGDSHGCGITADDGVVCWGTGNGTQLPGGEVPSLGVVAAGDPFDCGLDCDGNAICWDQSGYVVVNHLTASYRKLAVKRDTVCGIRDDTRDIECSSPTGPVVTVTGPFRRLSVGGAHGCGILDDGTVKCWGENLYGETQAPSGTFREVAAGYGQSCGVRTDGTLACWGESVR